MPRMQFQLIFSKEVVVENAGDAQQLHRVDAVVLKQFVGVGARAAQLTRKSHNAHLAFFHDFFDSVADVHVYGVLWLSLNKSEKRLK